MARYHTLLVSAAALAAIIGLPREAEAQYACDLNGLAQTEPTGTDSLTCGTFVLSVDPSDNLTTLGVSQAFSGENMTLIGSRVVVSQDAGGLFADASYAPPSELGATAVGAFSIVLGTGGVAVGDQAIVGLVDLSSGFQFVGQVTNGTAIGSSSLVTGDNGTAVGMSAQATALSATAMGQNAQASGIGSTAIGVDATASTGLATAVGLDANATGSHATALGPQTDATGADSTALGYNADATAANSVAIGANSVADQANTISVGAVGAERRIVNVASGTALTDAVNVSQLGAVSTNVTTLQTQITTVQTVNSTQTAQIVALQAVDAGFDTRIDAIEALALDFNEDLDRIDKRSAAGTAAAIALSGAMFLPGKTFNLTGNVGAYRGAVAGALQFGALVSDKMAVNAGIAHGFNKGGKTGVRAGFTLGW